MKRRRTLAVAGAVGLAAALATAPMVLADEHLLQAEDSALLTPVATAQAPIAGAAGPNGTLWIVERAGLVRVLDAQGLGGPVLDLTAETTTDGERGLSSIAFDEGFTHVYISFTNLDGHNQVDEIALANGQPQLATRRTVILVEQPGPAHNSGDIHFGPDGMLYMSLGDGDFSFDGDPHGNSQNLGTLLGGLIRIDLNSGTPYGIPPDNPFVGVPGARGEVFAYGLRNPWRFSFDSQTGDIWIGDVGQFSREEVNLIPAGTSGSNFGWPIMEGTLPWSGDPEPPNHVPPVLEYDTVSGQRCSVTGGYVYRGSAIPALQGLYLFSDWCEGDIRALDVQNGQLVQEINLGIHAGRPVAFVEGHELELYVLDIAGGTVYRIDPSGQQPTPTESPTQSPTPSPTGSPTGSPTESPTESPTQPVGDCLVQYDVSDWGGHPGFTATVSITNTGAATVDGWSLAWQYPAGQLVEQAWNATVSQAGAAVTATDAGWNGTIAPSQTVTFGFNGLATAVGNNPPPTAYTLNGTGCTVG